METQMMYRIAFPLRRELVIVGATIASLVITACSDVTAPKTLVPRGLPAATILAPQSGLATSVATINSAAAIGAAASRPCAAPGTGLPGALNMVHDASMFTIPMARDADQGNAGMFDAVDVSGC
jgi:hypothetical protein